MPGLPACYSQIDFIWLKSDLFLGRIMKKMKWKHHAVGVKSLVTQWWQSHNRQEWTEAPN